jgi:hypothetical protein
MSNIIEPYLPSPPALKDAGYLPNQLQQIGNRISIDQGWIQHSLQWNKTQCGSNYDKPQPCVVQDTTKLPVTQVPRPGMAWIFILACCLLFLNHRDP